MKLIDKAEVKKVDLDFEQELYKAFGQVKDFTFCLYVANTSLNLGLKQKWNNYGNN